MKRGSSVQRPGSYRCAKVAMRHGARSTPSVGLGATGTNRSTTPYSSSGRNPSNASRIPNLPVTLAIRPAGPYGTQVLMSIGYGRTGR